MGLLNALKMQIDSFWKVGHVILKPSQIKRSNHGEICGIGITDVCSCLLITIVMMPFKTLTAYEAIIRAVTQVMI